MADWVAPGKQTFVDANGKPLVGGLVWHYVPGTDDLKDTFQDEGELALNTNPVVLDGRGQAAIWGDGLYRQRLTDATGNEIWDRVTGVGGQPPNLPVTFANYAALRAYAAAANAGAAAFVEGYATLNDGGQGIFVYDATDLGTADNGGTVLVDVDLRRWKRQYAGPVQVGWFGAKGDGATDDSAAIQRAINTNADVLFTAQQYAANNLVQHANSQRFVGAGAAKIIKNANGPLFTSTGNNVECRNIQFRGDAAAPAFTGHNVVSTGENFHLINCGSRWAYDRAVKATGGGVQIINSADIYQTADATVNGYDIEIGVAGTATLYHFLLNIYSSQHTGGILLIDTGSAEVCGGQFGKLYIKKGTGPAGVNGGKTNGCRILGDVTVEVPSAKFTGCDFGLITITFALTANGCSCAADNTFENGCTIVNNGNANNFIERQTSSGSVITLSYGDTAQKLDITYNWNSAILLVGGTFHFKNNMQIRNGAGTGDLNVMNIFGGGDNAVYGDAGMGFNILMAGAGGSYLSCNGSSVVNATDTFFRPQNDNVLALGGGSQRWTVVYAVTGAINTSDERVKQDIAQIEDAVLDAWAEVEWCRYRFIDAVEGKGADARVHIGVIAQRVADAFRDHGLDPFRYGVLCYDAWDEHDVLEAVERIEVGSYLHVGDDGEEKERPTYDHVERYRTVPAGDRYGVRYEEALALEAALMRRELRRLRGVASAS